MHSREEFIRHLRRQRQHQNKVVKLSDLHVCGVVNRQVFGVFIDFSQWLLIDDKKYFPKDGVDGLVFWEVGV